MTRPPTLGLLLLALLTTTCDRRRGDAHEGHTTTTSASSAHASGHEGHGEAPTTPSAPTGYAPITIDPVRAAAIGLTTTRVEERDFVRQLRTTGLVVVDETRTAHVHSKVRGWVDGITVSFVGQRVSSGQVLCGIYSPEVYAAELEYLSVLGRRNAVSLPSGEFAEQERRAREELIAAARRRLALWDVPKGEIERLETSREARRTFPLLATRSGTVVAKQVLDGMSVDPANELYTITDLSRVWLLADVYEADVAAVHVGQTARLEVQGVAAPIESKVAFVPPTIDEPTRTLKVRFELANERRQLRPGAFATATMELALGRGLAVPESAVIRTGKRAIVFVVHEGAAGGAAREARHIMPREIVTGALVDTFYRVDEGLSAGDVVATGAQFLLDSESRLRATSGMGAGHGGH